jgi:hypothetical protein
LACCNCCVSKWDVAYLSQCCDPVPNDVQKSAILCDPSWCPFAPNCANVPSTQTYCLQHADNTNCLQLCTNFLQNMEQAPVWCDTFIPAYCKIKSANGQVLSISDSTLCACQMNVTSADECLFEPCQNSVSFNTWMTEKQRQHKTDATYCHEECVDIAQSVADQKSVINNTDFVKVCSEVPLPQPTQSTSQSTSPSTPPSTLPSTPPSTPPSTLQTILIICGVIIFLIIIIIIIVIMKYRSSKTLH